MSLTSRSGQPFEVPEPVSSEEVRLPDGAGIVLRRHGNLDGPRLVVSHGNGLAGDMVYPLWGRLLHDFEVVVFDLRNHGWNSVTDASRHHVPQFTKDVESVAGEIGRRFGEKPTLGVFHSVSSLAVCLSATRGDGFRGLFLLDPPVCRPGATYAEFDIAAARQARQTRIRDVRIRSLDLFAELLGEFPHFRKIPLAGRELYARTTFRPDPEGRGFVLRCPREYEARIIEYVPAFAVLVDLDQMVCPVKVLGADPTIPYAFLPTFNLATMLGCDYDFVPEANHLLFLERPDACADSLVEFAGTCGLFDS